MISQAISGIVEGAGGSGGLWGKIATGAQAAGVVSSAVGAYNKSEATKAAYEYQSAVARNNAQIAEWQARDAITRGQTAEQQLRLKAAALKGSQRASLAARGIALDEGSPLNILQDTDYMTNLDALTLRDNAAMEAWGYRNKSRGYASDSAMLASRAESESPFGAAATSLLSSAGSVADSWYRRTSTSKKES